MSQTKIKNLIKCNSLILVIGAVLCVYKMWTVTNSAKNVSSIIGLAMTMMAPLAIILFLVITDKPKIMRAIGEFYFAYSYLILLFAALGWATMAYPMIANSGILSISVCYLFTTIGFNTGFIFTK